MSEDLTLPGEEDGSSGEVPEATSAPEAHKIEVADARHAELADEIAPMIDSHQEQAEEPDSDRGANRVEDVDKAWGMAHAGKEERDKAAELRAEAKENKKLLSEIVSLNQETPQSDDEKEAHHNKRDGLQEKIKDRERERLANGFLKDARFSGFALEKILSDGSGTHYKEAAGEAIKDLEEKAEAEDRRASSYEDWAAVLHNHPVSESYEKRYPGVKFEARTLKYMEERVESDLVSVKKLEELLEKAPVLVGIYGIGDNHKELIKELINHPNNPSDIYLDPGNVINDAYGGYHPEVVMTNDVLLKVDESDQAKKEKYEQFYALYEDPNTTLGQLRDFYIEAFRLVYIEPRQNYAKVAESILEDIKSGQASKG